MIDDLRRQQEIDAFQLEAVSTGRCVLICAGLLAVGLVLDAIERRAPAPPVVVSVERHAMPLSHPLRGPDCDITITQRGAGKWEPERCAKGVRK